MNEVGHNKPPGMAATAGEVAQDLSRWMADHPTIETEEDAREAKVYRDRAALCVKDLEDERKLLVQPLNERVAAINETYKRPRSLLEKVLDELKMRIGRFIEHEERQRREAADRARVLAEEARLAAINAERIERDALQSAAVGQLDVDVSSVTAGADAAFADYQKAERQAKVAEKETKVRIGGGFTRALGFRSAEVIVIDSPSIVLAVMGITPDVYEAIVKSARAYKKLHGKWPAGVSVKKERRI